MQAGHRVQADWRGQRGMKCANCQSELHSTRDCPKPRIPEDQRLCHGCGKPGHIRAKCPNNRTQSRGIKAVENAEEDEYTFMVDFECQDCEWTYQKNAKRGPKPRTITIGDFIQQKQPPLQRGNVAPIHVANKFEALSEETHSRKKRNNEQSMTIEEIRRKMTPQMVTSNEPNDSNSVSGVDNITINAVMEPHEQEHEHEREMKKEEKEE